MRVVQNMLTSSLLRNLHSNLNNLNKYQNQLSTNSRILRISDDPIGAVSSIQIKNDIKKNEQYSKNISDAQSWLNETESNLYELNNILIRMKELANQSANGTFTKQQRDAIKEEVLQMRDQLLDIVNTKFAGKYIFGGYNTTSAPFKINAGTVSYNSISDISAATPAEIDYENDQVRNFKLSPSTSFGVSIPGTKVVGCGSDNLFALFEGFVDALDTDVATPELVEYASKFSKAQDDVLSLISDVGGRQKRLEHINTRYENEFINLAELDEKTVGIDQAEVITYFRMAENTYNTALQVGARIIQRSLVDFLS